MHAVQSTAAACSSLRSGTERVQILRRILRANPRVALALHGLRQAFAADRQRMVMTPYGFKIAGNALMQAGAFEPEETALLSELLPQHDRFIDCGANIGFFSCLARHHGKPVLAIEPLAANLRSLLANLDANGWNDSEVVNAGLADTIGIGEIFGADTGASMVRGWAGMPHNTLLRERVALTTLDTLVADRFTGERLLIKVDVEGGEFALLQGAARTLARIPPPTWMVEICLAENFPAGGNRRFAETFDLFFGKGYRAFAAKPGLPPVSREQVLQWAMAGRAEPGGHNYLFQRST